MRRASQQFNRVAEAREPAACRKLESLKPIGSAGGAQAARPWRRRTARREGEDPDGDGSPSHPLVADLNAPPPAETEGHVAADLPRYDDMFFLNYTNGTLLNPPLVDALARLGNVAPGISVEGYREATDARRGPGVYDKVEGAVERLRPARPPRAPLAGRNLPGWPYRESIENRAREALR
jgi:hypothetical protein